MNVEPTVSGNQPPASGAIRQAARVTGTDFQYLLATAQVEFDFNPNAAAPTSSARGLFQFIEQTWLATLKEQGPALGYGRYRRRDRAAAVRPILVTDPRLQRPDHEAAHRSRPPTR